MKTFYQQKTAYLARNSRSIILACVTLLLCSQSHAANYTASSTADPSPGSGNTTTLRGAIEAANNQSNGTHTITLNSGGTYNLSNGQLTFGENGGSLTIVVASGGTATINMVNNGAADRIFNINPFVSSGIGFTISNCTLSNGRLNSDPYGGGAIVHGGPSCSLSVTNCTFTGNTMTAASSSEEGGAICYAYGGTLSINQCTFINNSSLGGGGAITFKAYSVNSIYPNSSISVTNSTFTGNSATKFGGAISITSATPGSGSPTLSVSVTGNNFVNNSTSGSGGTNGGGAIALTNSISTGNTYLVNYNRFTGNTSAGAGPALWMTDAIGKVDATNNWWGCNSLPDNSSTCANKAIRASGSSAGTLTISPYLVARTTFVADSLCTGTAGNTSSVSVSFATNSNGQNVSANLGALNGKTVSFNVAAASSGLGAVSPTSATITSGAASTTFTTSGSTAGRVVLRAGFDNIPSNDEGLAKDSLYVRVAPGISTGPGNITPCAGTSPTLSVTATGTNISYQWRKGTTNLTNGATYSNVTTNTLTISNISAAQAGNDYNVVVSNTCGNVTSGNATVTVSTVPSITTGTPASIAPCAGTSPTMSVTASSSTPISYQWRRGTTNLTTPTYSNATTSTLTINNIAAAQAGSDYNVVVGNNCGSVTSSNATVTVNTVPSITTGTPASIAPCAGTSPTMSVTASSGIPISYQWRRGTTNLTTPTYSNATTSILTINNIAAAQTGSDYNVVVGNNCGSVTSSNATVTVIQPAGIATEPVDTTFCNNLVSLFRVTASGGGTYSYQWRKGTTVLVNGASTGNGPSTYSIQSSGNVSTLFINGTQLADSGYYNVIVSNGCGSDTSVNAFLRVNGPPSATALPVSYTGCPGNAATLNIGMSSSTPMTYQWYKGATQLADGFTGNGSVLSGVTTATMTLLYATTFDNATNYNVKVINGCSTFSSGFAAITINTATTPATSTSGTAVISTNNPILYNSSCGIITTLVPFGIQPIAGSVTASVTIDPTVQSYNGKAYVQRHYDIEPAVSAATATATTTLYFTQAEFNAFNATQPASAQLPTTPTDSAGKSRLRIYQYHGTGTNPGNYTGSREIINPADANIIWDASTSRWRVIFSVNGFSGFYASNETFIPLPLNLISFTGTMKGNIRSLQWTTVNEINTAYIIIERSTDAVEFTPLAKQATTGNGKTGSNYYSFEDKEGSAPLYHYRLKMVDNNGDASYSNIITLRTGASKQLGITAGPNPFVTSLEINIDAAEAVQADLMLTDVSNRMVLEKSVTLEKGVNKTSLNHLGQLAKGLYFLRISTGNEVKTIRVVKAD